MTHPHEWLYTPRSSRLLRGEGSSHDELHAKGAGSSIVPADDSHTTLEALKTAMRQFVAERAWEIFHSPKNLAMSLAIEAAEVMEHVQWLEPAASRELKEDPVRKAALGEEIADVFCYLLALCNALELDLTSATRAKMLKNQQKYPVEQFRGRFGHDDPSPAR